MDNCYCHWTKKKLRKSHIKTQCDVRHSQTFYLSNPCEKFAAAKVNDSETAKSFLLSLQMLLLDEFRSFRLVSVHLYSFLSNEKSFSLFPVIFDFLTLQSSMLYLSRVIKLCGPSVFCGICY